MIAKRKIVAIIENKVVNNNIEYTIGVGVLRVETVSWIQTEGLIYYR